MSDLTEYRILQEGEIIEAGDECDACANGWRDPCKWEPAPPHMIGCKAGNPSYPAHTNYRRALINHRQRAKR